MTSDYLTAFEIAEINDRTDLVVLVGNKVKLKAKRQEQVGLCPFHNEKTPSFYVIPDKSFFHCFGCGAHGDAVDFVERYEGIGFMAAIERLRNGEPLTTCSPTPRPSRTGRNVAVNHTEDALEIWRAAQSALGTTVETYLRNRDIKAPIPPSIRYHPNLTHTRTNLNFPVMVAAVQEPDRRITGIHRTYLLPDGRDKAVVEKPKMALGPLSAGAVRLAALEPALGLAEGIETALSAMQLFEIPTWAALGSRIDRVALPELVIEVQVFADNGEAGRRAADRAAEEFTQQGRRVALRFPPPAFSDWNDVLRAQETAA